METSFFADYNKKWIIVEGANHRTDGEYPHIRMRVERTDLTEDSCYLILCRPKGISDYLGISGRCTGCMFSRGDPRFGKLNRIGQLNSLLSPNFSVEQFRASSTELHRRPQDAVKSRRSETTFLSFWIFVAFTCCGGGRGHPSTSLTGGFIVIQRLAESEGHPRRPANRPELTNWPSGTRKGT